MLSVTCGMLLSCGGTVPFSRYSWRRSMKVLRPRLLPLVSHTPPPPHATTRARLPCLRTVHLSSSPAHKRLCVHTFFVLRVCCASSIVTVGYLPCLRTITAAWAFVYWSVDLGRLPTVFTTLRWLLVVDLRYVSPAWPLADDLACDMLSCGVRWTDFCRRLWR
jgi:hypothetical protein